MHRIEIAAEVDLQDIAVQGQLVVQLVAAHIGFLPVEGASCLVKEHVLAIGGGVSICPVVVSLTGQTCIVNAEPLASAGGIADAK